MWRELLRHQPATPDAGRDEEAILERYVEHPSPVRHWLEARIRQAPWWCISLLVHVCVVLILWSWPVPSRADVDAFHEIPIGIVDEPEQETLDREDEAPPIDTDRQLDDLDDFEIEDIQTPLIRGDESEVELETPPEPAYGAPDPEPVVSPIEGLPVIGPPADFARVPTGTIPPGDRGTLREAIRGKPVGDPELKTLVNHLVAALVWLAQAQGRDGSWDAKEWGGDRSYKVGMGGLALLAYLGAGCTHRKGSFQRVVARGLDWLARNQRPDGSFPWETFYEQGIATIAVCEAYGLTGDPRAGRVAQRAINYIVGLQPDHGGFRYGGAVPSGQGDTSVTGWQIMAIKAAILAGLDVPPRALDRCHAFLRNSARQYGTSAYLAGDQGAGSPAVTAVGLLCRIFLNDDHRYDNDIAQAVAWLNRRENPRLDTPARGAANDLVADLYYTYYSSLAMYQVGGENWRAWRKMYYDGLKAEQVKATRDAAGRFVKGSWEPGKHRWGKRGGRIYATAMGALCLEAPFRFLRLVSHTRR